ncbi:hypothetical protein U9M48_005074 [Paspalum notatum var. saurae]|uniref:Uncharacterized protein n=1 Tax=Paspalum notatum var. saurae TaxID=547442 RepID=A0AAQ3PRD7_PASNO
MVVLGVVASCVDPSAEASSNVEPNIIRFLGTKRWTVDSNGMVVQTMSCQVSDCSWKY